VLNADYGNFEWVYGDTVAGGVVRVLGSPMTERRQYCRDRPFDCGRIRMADLVPNRSVSCYSFRR
jgi:hypothetical protein